MADLAEGLGLSTSTVSRALRDDSRISRAVRERVREAAAAAGYRPNPMVSALMASRRQRGGGGETDTIALVTDYHAPESWMAKDVCRWEHEGICRRAAELGFRVEEFRMDEFGGDGARLERALRARGVRGVLLGFSRGRGDWRGRVPEFGSFAVAGLSAYFRGVPVDRANFHGLFNVRLALGELRKLGYRRTALVVPEFNNRISGFQWSSGFLDWQRHLPEEERCGAFLPGAGVPEDGFGRWLARERPDSIVAYKLPVAGWLAEAGLSVPGDVGVCSLFRTVGEMASSAGIDGLLAEVGAAAFDLVVERLNANRYGLPANPKEVLIKGRWVAGPTVAST